MWAAVRKLRTFTLLALQDATSPLVLWPTVDSYLQSLRTSGYVELVAPVVRARRGFGSAEYHLVKDSFEAPRFTGSDNPATQGAATLAMWRAMKVLKDFDYHDVLSAACLGPHCKVSPHTAKNYVVRLARAGYFRKLRESKPGTPARYRLVRDTGALAPAITRNKTVFDRNTGEFASPSTKKDLFHS